MRILQLNKLGLCLLSALLPFFLCAQQLPGPPRSIRKPPIEDGIYTLAAVHSNKLLEVSGGSPAAGANVQQAAPNNKEHQRWELRMNMDGSYRLLAVHSGKCLEAAPPATNNGANARTGDWRDQPHQKWMFVQAQDGSFTLLNRAAGKCLEVMGEAMHNGANVQVWDQLGKTSQRWKPVLIQTLSPQPQTKP